MGTAFAIIYSAVFDLEGLVFSKKPKTDRSFALVNDKF